MRIILPMPTRIRTVFQEIIQEFTGTQADSVALAPLSQVRYPEEFGFNLVSFDQSEAVLNLTETALLSFLHEEFLAGANRTVRIFEVNGLTAIISPGPPPIQDKMAIVTCAEWPGLRVAFHNLQPLPA